VWCLPRGVILVCPGCGRRLNEGTESCPSCGTALAGQLVAIQDEWWEDDPTPDEASGPRRRPVRPGLLVVCALVGLLVVLVFSVRHFLDDRTASSLASEWVGAQSADSQRIALENALNPFPSPSSTATANPAVALADLARLAGAEKTDLGLLRTHLARPWPFDHYGA